MTEHLLPFAALLLAAIAAGSVGSLVVVRRRTYVAGAISHSMLAGIGLSAVLENKCGIAAVSPFGGSVLAALAVAFVLAGITRKNGARTDAALSGVWAGGFAIGMILLKWATGEMVDLEEYLLGSVAEVSAARVAQMAVFTAGIFGVGVCGFNKLLAVAFDGELAQLRGVDMRLWECIFYVVTALTVAMLAYTVGIRLAIAFLAIPAVAAARVARRL